MARVMDVLREDHRNMKRMLDILEGQCEIIRDEGVPDYGLLSELVNYCLTYPDLYHHPKEDQIYRRLIRRGASPEQLGDMEAAHEELATLTRHLAKALDPMSVEAARETSVSDRKALLSLLESFVKTYRLHIEAEDLIFFPLAQELLEPDDWKEVDALMKRTEDPIFGAEPTDRFGNVKRALAASDQPAAAAC